MKEDIARVPFDSWNEPNIVYWIKKVPREIKTEDIPLVLGGIKRLNDVTKHFGIKVDFQRLCDENYQKKILSEQKLKLNKDDYEWLESEFLSARKEAILVQKKELATLIKKIIEHNALITFSFDEQREMMRNGLNYSEMAQLGLKKLIRSGNKKIREYMRIIGEPT